MRNSRALPRWQVRLTMYVITSFVLITVLSSVIRITYTGPNVHSTKTFPFGFRLRNDYELGLIDEKPEQNWFERWKSEFSRSTGEKAPEGCKKTGTRDATFWFCAKQDYAKSEQFKKHREWGLTMKRTLLDLAPQVGFVDIRPGHGYFSLLAAKSGHQVVAVDPFSENLQEIWNSSTWSKIGDRMTFFRNIVSDFKGMLSMRDPHTNRFVPVLSVRLSDMVDLFPFKEAVLRLDFGSADNDTFMYRNLFQVQMAAGYYECLALSDPEGILHKIPVYAIYIEGSGLARRKNMHNCLQKMVESLERHSFAAFSLDFKPVTIDRKTFTWNEEIIVWWPVETWNVTATPVPSNDTLEILL